MKCNWRQLPARLARAGLLVLCASCGSAWADASPVKVPPSYFAEPARVQINTANATYQTFGEFEIPLRDGEDPALKQGHYYHFDMKVDLPDGTPFTDTWRVLAPSLAALGWTTLFPGNGFYTIGYRKGGNVAWAVIGIFGPDDIRVDLVEAATLPADFSVPMPSAQPESTDASQPDFRLLPPLPGSRRSGVEHATDPMLVSLPDYEQPEQVGAGSTTRVYEGPSTLSNLEIITRYERALVAAGWTIANRIEGPHSSDGVLVAHYAKEQRNLWMTLHSTVTSYAIQLADEGAPNQLASELQRNCHVALTGVLFDFDKATLKSESEPVLQRVVDLAKASPALALEIQGHTDNVGDDDYNLKLSRARARSVLDWLVAHGVAPSRLASQGYGKTRPVASNDDDFGRAKNRRVEVARPDCRSGVNDLKAGGGR